MPSGSEKSDRKTKKNGVEATSAPQGIEARKKAELPGLLMMFASVVLLVFFIIKPSESRWLGAAYGLLDWLKLQFGVTMYFVSFLLWFFGIQKFMHGSITGRSSEFAGYFAMLLFSNLFFEMLNSSGGLFGRYAVSKAVPVMGNAGVLLLSIFGMLTGASIAFNILLAPLFVSALSGVASLVFGAVKMIVFATAFVFTFMFRTAALICGLAYETIAGVFSNSRHGGAAAGYADTGARVEKVDMFRREEELEKPRPDDDGQAETLETKLFSNFKNNDAPYAAGQAAEGVVAGGMVLDEYSAGRLENIARAQKENVSGPARTETPPEKTRVEKRRDAVREDAREEDGPDESLASRAEAGDLDLDSVPITRSYEAPREAGGASEAEEALLKNFMSKNSSGKFNPAPAGAGDKGSPYDDYDYPDFKAILKPVEKIEGISEEELKANAEKLVTTLKNFNVEVKIAHITCGPTVTRYELQPASGVKVSKVVGLADDLALALATSSLRMEAPIPGKAAIGVEVPNTRPVPVFFSELITLPEFNESRSPLLFALGKTITGQPIIADLRNMPHLLVAGTTGSGKSVCVNTIIASILFHARPDEVKFVMVDPKMVELTGYNDIPHLIHPVVVKVKDVPFLLEWGVYEMERRYRLLSAFGVRAIDGFNAVVDEYNSGVRGLNDRESAELVEQGLESLEKLPFLVFVIDELADIMMTDKSNKVEEYICRLAQMARAVGMHLIVATQRPSVNVITGLIKANLPSRIAFAVSSVTDSRTILDCKGAEKLIGRGDMLYLPTGLQKPVRVQGAYVRDDEIRKLTEFLRANYEPDYRPEVGEKISEYQNAGEGESGDGGGFDSGSDAASDELFYDAARLVVENKMGSASMLQRILKIGHNRALKLMDRMEKLGVVGPFEDKKPRKVLWTVKDLEDNIRKVA